MPRRVHVLVPHQARQLQADIFTEAGPQTSAVLERMLDFPFDADEEAHIFEWIQKAVSRASQYQAKSIALICDWASSRLIACGRYAARTR